MKHTLKITIILLAMFIATQLIGLYVVNHYAPLKYVDGEQVKVDAPDLPFGLETPEIEKESDYQIFFYSIIFAFIVAISLLFLLSKFKAEFILKLWFFVVVLVALTISLLSVLPIFKYTFLLAIVITVPLAFMKIYGRNFLVHNITELFIYPGIAAVFVPILNLFWVIMLLILISLYDMWAVWRSGIMQKMASYQMDKLNIFGGFLVPYASKKVKETIKKIKKSVSKSKLKKKKIKINVAILGGGDIIFPLIAAGVMLKTMGLFSSFFVIIGATTALSFLFFLSKKNIFYPAMPFITAGILLGIGASYLFL